VCVDGLAFALRCLPSLFNTHEPEGYLFVCPPEDVRAGDWLRWPDCPAYWSLNPSGASRLRAEDPRILGFIIHIETTIYGSSWDETVYDELRLKHRGRGWDTDRSRDISVMLLKLSTDAKTLLACSEHNFARPWLMTFF
jgi:hypothetical protein